MKLNVDFSDIDLKNLDEVDQLNIDRGTRLLNSLSEHLDGNIKLMLLILIGDSLLLGLLLNLVDMNNDLISLNDGLPNDNLKVLASNGESGDLLGEDFVDFLVLQ
jgi:hypothetical protein